MPASWPNGPNRIEKEIANLEAGSPVGHWAGESGTSGVYRVPCCQERQEYVTREVFEQRARRSVYAVRTRRAERGRLGC